MMRVHVPLSTRYHHVAHDVGRIRTWLLGLLLFNGIGAVFGGVGLLTDSIGAPLSLLDGTPFTDFTIPGWVLLVVVGGTSLGAALMLWKRTGHAALASILAGIVLLGWILTEFAMIPKGWPAQLLYVAIGVAVTRLGWLLFVAGEGAGEA